MQTACFETVSWKAKAGVTDESMTQAVNNMVADLQTCEGFLHQALYKNDQNHWVDVYYWQNEACAHASNEYMANKASFLNLIALLDMDSVSIEVMMPLQASGGIAFKSFPA